MTGRGKLTARAIALLTAALLGVFAAALVACGDDETTTTETVTETTPAATGDTGTTPTTTGETTTGTDTTTTDQTTTEDEDVSGNCDEAEHENDPECLSGGDGGNSGPG